MRRLTGLATGFLLVLAAAPVDAQARRLVYDPRWPEHHAEATRAEQALIDRVLLPADTRRWRADDEDCARSVRSLAVVDVVEGSFTRPGARQRAIAYIWCRPAVVIAYGGIAVLERGRVVWHLPSSDWPYEMRRVPDLDGDGRDELFLRASQTEQGHSWAWGTLYRIGGRGVHADEFQVEEDDCGMEYSRVGRRARLLYVVPGPRPRFSVREYAARCEHPRWRAQGGFVRPEPNPR